MTIKKKLVTAFLAVTVAPTLLLGILIFQNSKEALKSARIAQLENIADLKKDKIETFFAERRADLTAFQNFRNIRRNLPILIDLHGKDDTSSYLKALAELDSQLKPFQGAYGYLDVMLTDSDGRVVYAANDSHKRADFDKFPLDKKVFDTGREGIYFSDVFVNKSDGVSFEIYALAPLKDFSGKFIGEVILEINMEPIYKLIQDSTGLGTSGEALIVKKEGDSVLFISPLRGDPHAALRKKVPFNGKKAYPAQMTLSSKSGSGFAIDYNGVEVLAAWRYVPHLRWGLVTKMNSSEALAPVFHLMYLSVFIGTIILFVGVVISLLIARSFSKPITALERGAEIIGSGNLDCRVGNDSEDEIGRLSRAFDRMTVALAQVDAELRQKAAELEAANKELESFSYSVSHDLRAPLRHIIGFVELLQKSAGNVLDETSFRYLDTISSSAKKMGELIDDLLAFSRIGRSAMKMGRVNVGRLVNETISDLKQETAGRNVEWKVGTFPDVYGDASMLRLVFVNLISNAVKFTNTRPNAIIEIGYNEEKEDYVFFIRDNGVGFDMKYADKLFNVFQRLHTQREFEGTGIGLANVKRIVSRHEGRTWAEATIDGGAVFYFTMPKPGPDTFKHNGKEDKQ